MKKSASSASVLLLATALGTAACEAPPEKPQRALVTLFTLQALLNAEIPSFAGGLSKVFPAMPPYYFLSKPDQVKVALSYTGGKPSPYMTTDIWVNFPAVWIQPMYVFVTKWDHSAPRANVHPKHKWVFSVGPKSGFWSPFWQTFYVVLPDEGVEDGTYKTVRDILKAGLPIHRGPGRLVAAVPTGMRPQPAEDVLPPFGAAIAPLRTANPTATPPVTEGSPILNRVWIDGEDEQFEVLDFGPDRFEWNDRGEVVEQPLFFFFTRGPDGRGVPLLDAPRVGGTGPIFARRPPIAPANRPLFGSFWRIYAAHLPPRRSIVFIPRAPAFDEVRDHWREDIEKAGASYVGPLVFEPDPALVDDPAALAYAMKIALETPDSACLKTKETLPSCRWLDSQEAIENLLPQGIEPSELTVACPYIGYDGKIVPRFP